MAEIKSIICEKLKGMTQNLLMLGVLIKQFFFLNFGQDLYVHCMYLLFDSTLSNTANEGPVRIQYKCLVPIHVFPKMKQLFPKQNYNVMSPRSYTHISVRDLYISRIGLPILLQGMRGIQYVADPALIQN
jgi:hypothetical protein